MKAKTAIVVALMMLIAFQIKAAKTSSQKEQKETNPELALFNVQMLDSITDMYLILSHERYRSGKVEKIDNYRLEEIAEVNMANHKYEKAGFGYLLLAFANNVKGDSASVERYIRKYAESEQMAVSVAKKGKMILMNWCFGISAIVLMALVGLLLMFLRIRKMKETVREAMDNKGNERVEEMMVKERESYLTQRIEEFMEGKSGLDEMSMAEELFGAMRKNNSKVTGKMLLLLLLLCSEKEVETTKALERLEVGKSRFFEMKKILHDMLGMENDAKKSTEDYRAAVARYLAKH